MSMEFWAKMPCNWQADPLFHTKIRAAPIGDAIAALKLYIGLCLKANYGERATLPSTGCAKQSITKLCELVDLSRPMVIRGLRLLEQWNVIEVLGGRPAVYRIKEYETAKYWTKLPKTYIFGGSTRYENQARAFWDMGCRGRHVLHALQLYLYMAAIRDRHTSRATVSYVQIGNVLGLTKNNVSRAITVLTANDLITVRQAEGMSDTSRTPTNAYWLRGSEHDPMQAHRRALTRERMDGQIQAEALADFTDLIAP